MDLTLVMTVVAAAMLSWWTGYLTGRLRTAHREIRALRDMAGLGPHKRVPADVRRSEPEELEVQRKVEVAHLAASLLDEAESTGLKLSEDEARKEAQRLLAQVDQWS